MSSNPSQTTSLRKLNWGWTGVNIACWLLGDLVYNQLGRLFFFSGLGFLPIIASALVVALGQWLYLRTKFKGIGWWILATTVGMALLLFAREIQTIAGEYGMAPVILLIVSGGWVLLGLLQYLVLRVHLARAGWWILGSTIGILVSVIIIGLAYALYLRILFNRDTAASTSLSNWLMDLIILGGPALGYLAYGLITGYVFHRLSSKTTGEKPAENGLDEEQI